MLEWEPDSKLESKPDIGAGGSSYMFVADDGAPDSDPPKGEGSRDGIGERPRKKLKYTFAGCFHETSFSELCVTSCDSRSPTVTHKTFSDPSSPYASGVPFTGHQAPDVILSEGLLSFMRIFLQDLDWKCVWLAVTDREAASNVQCSPVYY